MPNTNDTSAASRRGLLSSVGAALLMGSCTPNLAPAAAVNPDAELLALCAEFHRHHADVLSLPDTGDYTWEDAIDERWEVSGSIEGMRPVTEQGRRAKAAVALVMMEEQYPGDGGATIQFAVAALRDLAGRA